MAFLLLCMGMVDGLGRENRDSGVAQRKAIHIRSRFLVGKGLDFNGFDTHDEIQIRLWTI